MTISLNAPKNKKKILVVDDSALMRRVMCDIINSDERFQVIEQATDGEKAYELLKKNTYDGVVLDVNMPRMDGIQLLQMLQKDKIRARIMMASTDTKEGASVTMEALELGAIDFIEKPANILYLRQDFWIFSKQLYRVHRPIFQGNRQYLSRKVKKVPVNWLIL